MDNNKKTKTLTILGILILLITFIGATYAYFQAQGGTPVTKNVNVLTHTVDTLTFSVSDNISIEATQQNFTNGGNNLSGEATTTAILTPNSNTGSATKHYYVYLKLDSNNTVYSAANTNNDPEVMLQVFNSSDQLVTLTGLGTQKTVDSLTGYDITGVTGAKVLLDNHEITASNNQATTETYRIVITLVNHNFNQNDNTGKSIVGSIIVRETELTYCETDPTNVACQIDLTYNPEVSNSITLTGTGVSGYLYHHDATLTNGAGDGGYRYAGANPNNYVCFGSTASTCPDTNLYRIIGLVPVDVVTDATTTPVTTERQTLYKIIKNDYIGSTELGMTSLGNVSKASPYVGPSGNQPSGNVEGFYWSGSNSNQSNTWSSSTLNTSGLNGSYLTNIGSTWSDKIATVMWKVGGGDNSYIRTATPMSTVYRNEITESGQHVTNAPTDGKNELPAKVGLMYVSDYGYAAPSASWSTSPSSYNGSTIIANNWLYRGVYEWTVSRGAGYTNRAYRVRYDGFVDNGNVSNDAFGVRPVLYLNSSTSIVYGSHAGTASDPYRIN